MVKLKEIHLKASSLEEWLKSMAGKYEILQLDYGAAISDIENNSKQNSDEDIKEKLCKMKQDLNDFKGLYEANRSSGRII